MRSGIVATANDVIDQRRGNRVARHVVVLGFVRILNEADAAEFLDALDAHRAVGAGPRQHDRGRVRAVRLGQRPEEDVHRRSPLLEARDLRQHARCPSAIARLRSGGMT